MATLKAKKTWSAAADLLLATSIWGFGFTATIWALKSFDSVLISVIRFSIACFIGLIILALQPSRRSEINLKNLRLSFWPGVFISLTLILQTWGLEYTSATNSSFITTLYVVIVPLMELAIFKRRLRRLHLVWVIIALIGTGLMINLQLGRFNFGDLLTLGCSLTAALQIIMVGRVSHRIDSPFAFNIFQSLWAAIVAVAFAPIYHNHYFHTPGGYAIAGLLSLTFGSTLFAFYLQIKAQKTLSPSLSSLIFLLESPFASLFAFLLLDEKITLLQGLGGILIFASAYGATKIERA